MNTPLFSNFLKSVVPRLYLGENFAAQVGLSSSAEWPISALIAFQHDDKFDPSRDIWIVMAKHGLHGEARFFSNAFGCDAAISPTVKALGIGGTLDEVHPYVMGAFPSIRCVVACEIMVAVAARKICDTRRLASMMNAATGCKRRAQWSWIPMSFCANIDFGFQIHLDRHPEDASELYAMCLRDRTHYPEPDGSFKFVSATGNECSKAYLGLKKEWDVRAVCVAGAECIRTPLLLHRDPSDTRLCDYVVDLSCEAVPPAATKPSVLAIAIDGSFAPRIRATQMDVYSVLKKGWSLRAGKRHEQYVVVNDDGAEVAVPSDMATVVATA